MRYRILEELRTCRELLRIMGAGAAAIFLIYGWPRTAAASFIAWLVAWLANHDLAPWSYKPLSLAMWGGSLALGLVFALFALIGYVALFATLTPTTLLLLFLLAKD